jgi:uncharacterized protein (DUF488 family)
MSEAVNPILTIGHSTHDLAAFLALLRQHKVGAVADVRSFPFSRFNPQFNREILARFLDENGFQYVFLGRELGARPEDRSCYDQGRVQYARLAQTPLFQSGLDRVQKGALRYRIALMCSEKEPLQCHRTLLVAKALVERGQLVQHIHADARLESHEAAMERLLEITGLPKEDLFRARQDLVAQALAKQEKQVAYVDEEAAATPHRDNLP